MEYSTSRRLSRGGRTALHRQRRRHLHRIPVLPIGPSATQRAKVGVGASEQLPPQPRRAPPMLYQGIKRTTGDSHAMQIDRLRPAAPRRMARTRRSRALHSGTSRRGGGLCTIAGTSPRVGAPRVVRRGPRARRSVRPSRHLPFRRRAPRRDPTLGSVRCATGGAPAGPSTGDAMARVGSRQVPGGCSPRTDRSRPSDGGPVSAAPGPQPDVTRGGVPRS